MNTVERLTAALDGRYRVDRELGAGGMATVYLAEDLKHHRKVAIKVLREDLSASVGAARFLREIEIAAQLQHPHILPLLDSGEADGLLFYVMPYVDGKSLRERLDREHELPVGESIRVLIEIVDALSAAHAHGVVHRDIKPDNVMLSGRHALVADFGVARAVSEAKEANPITTMGVALGTPAYMSPEQASADPGVDHRTDIYAVGIVAYEMLAGQLPFSARSPQQMLAAHVTELPEPLAKRRPGLDPQLVDAVMRCLEKRPADRWQSANDLLASLEPLATSSGGAVATAARLPAVHSRKPLVWMGVGAAVTVAAAILAASRLANDSAPSLTVGRSRQLTSDAGLQIFPAISPDGKLVAYAAGNSARMRIYVRPVGGGRTITVSDDSTAVESQPRWSPDGSQLLFLSRGGMSVAPALGGAARALLPRSATSEVEAAAWAPDGQSLAVVRGDSLFAIPAEGGPSRFIAGGTNLNSCDWSPDGQWIACVSGNDFALRLGHTFGNIAPSGIVVVAAAGGTMRSLTDGPSMNNSPKWARDGRLYFISNRDGPRDVYELALDGDGGARDSARRLTTGLNAHSLSVSADGRRLAYAVYSSRANVWSLLLGGGSPASGGTATPVTSGSQSIESLRLSRDGRWLLVDSDFDGHANIYRVPAGGGQPEQLTREEFNVFAPDLSSDGRHLAYHSFRGGTRDIEVKPIDGGEVERVTNSPAQEMRPVWSPDGSSLAFYDGTVPFRIFVVRRESPGRWSRPREVARGAKPHWSADGQSLLFLGHDSVDRGALRLDQAWSVGGFTTISVVEADGGGARTIYAASETAPVPEHPLWSADGRAVFFKSHDREGRASFWTIPATGGIPRLLARLDDLSRPSSRQDFATDGKRLFFTIEDRQSNVWVADVLPRK